MSAALDTRTDLELFDETLPRVQAPIPCHIIWQSRAIVCLRPQREEHDADLQIITSCGCVIAYCQPAFDFMHGNRKHLRPKGQPVVCSRHGGEPVEIHVIAVEPLR